MVVQSWMGENRAIHHRHWNHFRGGEDGDGIAKEVRWIGVRMGPWLQGRIFALMVARQDCEGSPDPTYASVLGGL